MKALGNAAFQRGDYVQAATLFRSATSAPDISAHELAAIYSNLSVALLRHGDGEGALEAADQCALLREDWGKSHFRRGDALIQLGRYEEAVKALRRALALEPTPEPAYSQRLMEAEREVKKIEMRNLSSIACPIPAPIPSANALPSPAMQRGVGGPATAASASNTRPLAVPALDRVAPTSSSLALVVSSPESTQLDAQTRSLSLSPNHPHQLELAILEEDRERKYMTHDLPAGLQRMLDEAALLVKSGLYHEAIVILKKFMLEVGYWCGPRTYHAHCYMGLCLHALGLHSQSLHWLQQAADICPHLPQPQIHLGVVLDALKKFDALKLVYERLCKLEPQATKHHVDLVHLLVTKTGDWREALRHLKKIRGFLSDRLLGIYYGYLLLLLDPETNKASARLTFQSVLGDAFTNLANNQLPTLFLLAYCCHLCGDDNLRVELDLRMGQILKVGGETFHLEACMFNDLFDIPQWDELDDLLKRDRVLSSSKAEQVHEKVVPVSFVMPQERGPLQVYARNWPNHRWICKTSSAHADGKTQKMRPTLIDEELLQMEEVLVQRYVESLRMDTSKFTLNCFVVVYRTSPLCAYIFRDGMVYKESPQDVAQGHYTEVMSLYEYERLMASEKKHLFSNLWANIKEVCGAALQRAQPWLQLARQDFDGTAQRLRSQIFIPKVLCFKIVVDEDLIPWIVKIERSPPLSFAPARYVPIPSQSGSDVEREIKQKLMIEAWSLSVKVYTKPEAYKSWQGWPTMHGSRLETLNHHIFNLNSHKTIQGLLRAPGL